MLCRWRSLLAVDDLVEGVVGALERTGVLDSTFIVSTRGDAGREGERRRERVRELMWEWECGSASVAVGTRHERSEKS